MTRPHYQEIADAEFEARMTTSPLKEKETLDGAAWVLGVFPLATIAMIFTLVTVALALLT